jgi:hydrogenase nickel incorporation protein HypB
MSMSEAHQVKIVKVLQSALAGNDAVAEALRRRFQEAGVFVINVIGAPGAGKTSFITRTIELLKGRARVGVLEGDVAGSLDTQRVLEAGAHDAVQINTGGSCHLDAAMVEQALPQLNLEELDVLFIENVGNLICPTHWALGADVTLCLTSAAEGHDKPLKYPEIFARCDVVVLNKVDLIELTGFDCAFFYEHLRALTDASVFEVSCRTGEGLEPWCSWLGERVDRSSR